MEDEWCNICCMEKGNELPISSLKFLTGPLAGNIYPITKDVTSLGRGMSNDIVIFDPSVSRHHAQIIWENDMKSSDAFGFKESVIDSHSNIKRTF